MSNLAVQQQAGMALAPQTEEDVILVLQNSLYPGANINSVRLVLSYCQAAGLDPMQKPVHIVPMYDRNQGGMRDVIMPGVNLYRTQASRTGQFAGISEPEFGPMIEEVLGGQNVRYPEWCRVSVERMLSNGAVAKFTAIEYWIENYAVKGGKEKSIAPNAMWTKRPRGQIAKCAEAQALRKAFPECGSQPTAEEMEGKAMGAEPDASAVSVHAITQDWAAAATACATETELTAVWQAGVKEVQAANDKPEYDRLKAAVAKRGKELTAIVVAPTEHVAPMTEEEAEAADLARGAQP